MSLFDSAYVIEVKSHSKNYLLFLKIVKFYSAYISLIIIFEDQIDLFLKFVKSHQIFEIIAYVYLLCMKSLKSFIKFLELKGPYSRYF